MVGLYKWLRIKFTNPLNSDCKWYQSHFLYKIGDVVRWKIANTDGFRSDLFDALILCVDFFGTKNQAHYLVMRLNTGQIMHYYKWDLEHRFKRIRRNVLLTDIMTKEEGLTHKEEIIRYAMKELCRKSF